MRMDEYIDDQYIFKTTDINKAKELVKSQDMAIALWKISQMLRNKIKYNDDKLHYETLIAIQDEFNNIIENLHLSEILTA